MRAHDRGPEQHGNSGKGKCIWVAVIRGWLRYKLRIEFMEKSISNT